MKNKKIYLILALLAAAFYALNIPLSKLLLDNIPHIILAGLLYIGAGIGTGLIFLISYKRIKKEDLLDKNDAPYAILMVILDIIAPIFLMFGLSKTTAGNASLLNNFEVVATSLIALFIFKEMISRKLWIAIFLVTIASIILSIEDVSAFKFSYGSIFVLLATICWGLENNCTRKMSHKNKYQIVAINGLCSGTGSLIIGLVLGESLSNYWYIIPALLLGYVAYGLSIVLYIKAQSGLGAAKTSSFYAINPFIATAISMIIFGEKLTLNYIIALIIMILGTSLIIFDTITLKNNKTGVENSYE